MCVKIQKIRKDFVVARDPDDQPNILQDLRFILTILKAMGLFPIYIQRASNEIEAPSTQSQLYSFFVRTLFHSLTIFNLYNIFYNGFSLHKFAGETDNINQYIDIIISVTTYTGAVVLFSKHSKDFLTILKDILKVDSDIQHRYGATVANNCKFCGTTVIGVIGSQIFLVCTNLTILGFTHPPQFLAVILYSLQFSICAIALMALSMFLRVLSMRFDFVNLILENYTYSMGGIKQRGPNNLSFEEDVLFAFRLHNKLLKTYKLLNESLSLVVALFMGYAFYAITTNTYNIFVEFTTKRFVSLILLLNCFVWFGLNTILLSILTSGCGETTRKANRTSQILARVYGKEKDYQIIVDKFLTKSIRQEVQFTAYGFFVVDNSTLFNIFSAVTTYLVILIQFKQLEDTSLTDGPPPPPPPPRPKPTPSKA